MPQQITHPYDHQSHVLILIPTPTYPDGVFSCDACMKHGNGFAYHCGACSIDLHPSCASKPLVLTHQSNPHQLSLSFSLPPGFNNSKTFICNICNQVGYKEWLYMCNPCGFTAHLGCATAKPRAPPPPPSNQQIQAAAQAAFVGTPCFPTSTISASPHQRNKSGKELGKAIVNTAAQVLIGANDMQGVGISIDFGSSTNATTDPSPFGSTYTEADYFGGTGGVGDTIIPYTFDLRY
ncbi:uncharacterized protein Pyn_19557 [Prunus yedoensis var. nudiflora]|uniref:DC1 domain-containing protein n=1 Tax=Prunus yedoensis var. nudiflora TaxID=2094558 RepID=A0A314V0C1_PRUYE|nr:uncharacterized protein Pyn_19557 [Prunus yedoensis var. nudiflora]